MRILGQTLLGYHQVPPKCPDIAEESKKSLYFDYCMQKKSVEIIFPLRCSRFMFLDETAASRDKTVALRWAVHWLIGKLISQCQWGEVVWWADQWNAKVAAEESQHQSILPPYAKPVYRNSFTNDQSWCKHALGQNYQRIFIMLSLAETALIPPVVAYWG